MKNVNILTTDIAAINALSGVERRTFYCRVSGKLVRRKGFAGGLSVFSKPTAPVEVGPGIFINRVYSKDSQSLCGNCAMTCLMVWHPAHFHFLPFRLVWDSVVSFRDNGPAALINIGIVHENVLNAFCADFPGPMWA